MEYIVKDNDLNKKILEYLKKDLKDISIQKVKIDRLLYQNNSPIETHPFVESTYEKSDVFTPFQSVIIKKISEGEEFCALSKKNELFSLIMGTINIVDEYENHPQVVVISPYNSTATKNYSFFKQVIEKFGIKTLITTEHSISECVKEVGYNQIEQSQYILTTPGKFSFIVSQIPEYFNKIRYLIFDSADKLFSESHMDHIITVLKEINTSVVQNSSTFRVCMSTTKFGLHLVGPTIGLMNGTVLKNNVVYETKNNVVEFIEFDDELNNETIGIMTKCEKVIFGDKFNQPVNKLPNNIKEIYFGGNYCIKVKKLPTSIQKIFIKYDDQKDLFTKKTHGIIEIIDNFDEQDDEHNDNDDINNVDINDKNNKYI